MTKRPILLVEDNRDDEKSSFLWSIGTIGHVCMRNMRERLHAEKAMGRFCSPAYRKRSHRRDLPRCRREIRKEQD
jgi:hypothetical protein